ncbi:hypothetical protein [Vibrio breoganii]|nr:hypothetical protein [Vibrio breoganii]MDN3715475.1 hypothetical protein [Vibrio breoganii]
MAVLTSFGAKASTALATPGCHSKLIAQLKHPTTIGNNYQIYKND